MKRFQITSFKYLWILGFAGIFAFVPSTTGELNYFPIVFFGFFASELYRRMNNQYEDERYTENVLKAKSLTLKFIWIGFLGMLFLLKNSIVSRDDILLAGSIIFVISIFIYPIIFFKLEKY